jgi:4-hydroxy-tetrahydrodipicolinate reductase
MSKLAIIICGATGRMGKELIALCNESPDLKLIGACTRGSNPLIGQDVGNGVRLTNSLDVALQGHDPKDSGPVIVDFSLAEGLAEHAAAAARLRLPIVVGASGLNEHHHALLKQVSAQIPVLVAPSTSIVANLLGLLSAQAARVLEDADVEICELHHRMKKDSPSGTAYFLAKEIAKARHVRFEDVACFNRHEAGPRKPGEIGIVGLRGGDAMGTHTVHFLADGESFELTHRGSSRRIFAQGALKAALFLAPARPGLYNMFDVFQLTGLLGDRA